MANIPEELIARWSKAFDLCKEAEKRFREAKIRKDKAVNAFSFDYDKALEKYNAIVTEIDDAEGS